MNLITPSGTLIYNPKHTHNTQTHCKESNFSTKLIFENSISIRISVFRPFLMARLETMFKIVSVVYQSNYFQTLMNVSEPDGCHDFVSIFTIHCTVYNIIISLVCFTSMFIYFIFLYVSIYFYMSPHFKYFSIDHYMSFNFLLVHFVL